MLTISDVAAGGDRFQTLVALRDRLARDLDTAEEPRDVAQLVLRLTDVLQQIDEMPTSHEVSAADEIANRRLARRTGRAENKTRAARPS